MSINVDSIIKGKCFELISKINSRLIVSFIIREKSSPKQKKIKQTVFRLKRFRFRKQKMLATAKYDPVSVYKSCAISDSVFSCCSSTAFIIIKIMIIHVIKNSTCGMRVHSHTVYRSSTVVCFDFSEI